MNQKNYKEIARIIRNYVDDYIGNPFLAPYKWIAGDLADYFEREKGFVGSLKKGVGFDKKQFLKDCGVEG